MTMEYDKEYLEKVKTAQASFSARPKNNLVFRMKRKSPLDMSSVMEAYVKDMKISRGLDTHRIYEAWDSASGAGPFTLRKFFRSGTLYITLTSSMVRSQLWFQRAELAGKINSILSADPLFSGNDNPVKNIILK